ncbi:hypothetical protein XELAEV_18039529mg [Xenopus laevis]|uniref:Uncharacterized protein n=1 Tax=Xenopus laevis TaxID=8355 RepID=A0A974C7Y6_XENLA|nr:hypothetical protein XELAEV_18039529mg [Xenopus laevis]
MLGNLYAVNVILCLYRNVFFPSSVYYISQCDLLVYSEQQHCSWLHINILLYILYNEVSDTFSAYIYIYISIH